MRRDRTGEGNRMSIVKHSIDAETAEKAVAAAAKEGDRTQTQDVHRRHRRDRRYQGFPSHGRRAEAFDRYRAEQGLYRCVVFHADGRLVRFHQGRSATAVRDHAYATPDRLWRWISDQTRG